MPYEVDRKLEFRETDPDCLGGVRAYLELFELVFSDSMHEKGLGNDVLPYRFGVGWVFAKYRLRILRKCDFSGPLHIATWPSGRPGSRFMTHELSVEQGGRTSCVGRLESCFYDLAHQRVTTPKAVGFPAGLYESGSVDVGDFVKLDHDPAGAVAQLRHTVRFSDLDNNGHMNNLRYSSLMMDAFSRAELDAAGVRIFEIHFLAQCQELEELTVMRRDEEALVSDLYMVSGSGDVVCRAKVWRDAATAPARDEAARLEAACDDGVR